MFWRSYEPLDDLHLTQLPKFFAAATIPCFIKPKCSPVYEYHAFICSLSFMPVYLLPSLGSAASPIQYQSTCQSSDSAPQSALPAQKQHHPPAHHPPSPQQSLPASLVSIAAAAAPLLADAPSVASPVQTPPAAAIPLWDSAWRSTAVEAPARPLSLQSSRTDESQPQLAYA